MDRRASQRKATSCPSSAKLSPDALDSLLSTLRSTGEAPQFARDFRRFDTPCLQTSHYSSFSSFGQLIEWRLPSSVGLTLRLDLTYA